jgi:hypothetical protein
MLNFLRWLILSSADANKFSLMVKGFLLALIPTLVTIAGLTDIHIPNQETLTQAVEGIATAIQIGLGVIAGAVAFVGAVRKVLKTLKGDNDVIKSIDRGEFD